MMNDFEKRQVSDFVDGELPASECEKLFNESVNAAENNKYLHTLRFVKRATGELNERAPEKLKTSVSAFVTKTGKMKKKAVAFSFLWVILTVLFAAVLVWAIWNPVPGNDPLPSNPSSQVSSESGNSSEPESSTVSSETSSDPSSSETSSAVDYSTYLPYGIDEYLKQSENYEDYRGMKFAFVVIAHGTKVNTLIENRPGQFANIVDEPRVWALISSKMTVSETEAMFRANDFTGIEVIEDEKFDGIDKSASLGLVFVRAE